MADNRIGDYPVVLPYRILDRQDDGSEVELDIGVAQFDSITLKIVNSDGTVRQLAGALTTDGSDGRVDFTTKSDTWIAVGNSKEQVQMVQAGTKMLSTAVLSREIERIL